MLLHPLTLMKRCIFSNIPGTSVFQYQQKAGIKEGLYDVESLASYLLYRLNVLDPICE